MNTAIEFIKDIRYKLRMFDVTIDGTVNLHCDIESVYKNKVIPVYFEKEAPFQSLSS